MKGVSALENLASKRMGMRPTSPSRRTAVGLLLLMMAGFVGCSDDSELQDLQRGRDTRPGIKDGPPEESQ
jgi:hypothetical protein